MPEQKPSYIGRYKVLAELGGGGMGDVYRIWDEATERELALKKLKFSYPRALHYFKREFRAVSNLSHPNLVSLYDLHSDKDQYYYTMELIRGTDIYEFVNGHNRVITDPEFLTNSDRIERIRTCMVQLFRGLAFLHRHNRIHRDIKPSNLLMNQSRRLKLVDFGIVKELLPGGQGQSLSQVFGTSTYFSPEQSLGSDVTYASDNYSAGVVLYEMLAGVPPFVGESADVAIKHRNTAPPSLAQRVPSAPAELVLLCMKLLAKKPEDRPTAREALMELDVDFDSEAVAVGEFIGRAQQRKHLHEFLGLIQSGQGQAVVLSGESGIGKTALLDEFARESALFGADFFSGTCTMRDHVAMRGLDTVIERIAEAYRKETARALRRLTDSERGLLLDQFVFLKELLPADEHGQVPQGQSTGLALSKLLDQLAKRRALVLVIEQIELADEILLATMEDMFSGSFMPPVLFIFTLNPRFVVEHSKLSSFIIMLERLSMSHSLELAPFSLEETIQFIEEHCYPAPRFLADYIHDETKGIPAYLRLLTQQVSKSRGGEMPRLKDILTRKFEACSKEAILALQTLAAADRRLSMDVLKSATEMDGQGAFAALQELRGLNLVDLLTTDTGLNYVIATESNSLALVRQTLSANQIQEIHEALAKAYEKHRGSIDEILRHWQIANQRQRGVEYAWHASTTAETDGDHARASQLLKVCFEHAEDDSQRARFLRRLADSLSRQGLYKAAWSALEDLRKVTPEDDTRIRAKCCQYALLCGDLDGFEDNFVKLPRAARPALATLLPPYLPHRTSEFVEHNHSLEAQLAKATTAVYILDDKSVREAQIILDDLTREALADEPELLVLFTMARGQLLAIQGKYEEARAVFNRLEDNHFDQIMEPHRFKPDFELTLSQVLYWCGDYLSARSLARSVERYAQQFHRVGLATRSGLLLEYLNYACEETHNHNGTDALRKQWHPRTYSALDAQLDLLDALSAFHQHRPEEATRKLDTLANLVHFADALTFRSIHGLFWEIRARISIYEMLTQSRLPPHFQADVLFAELRKHQGFRREYIGVLKLAMLYAQRKWSEVDTIHSQKGSRSQNPIAEALSLAIRGAALERSQNGGMRAWQASLHCLKNAGLALPPEVHHFKANFEKLSVQAS